TPHPPRGPRSRFDGLSSRNRLSYFRQDLVGVRGFEPPTTCTPCRCATRLRYTPIRLRKRVILSKAVAKVSSRRPGRPTWRARPEDPPAPHAFDGRSGGSGFDPRAPRPPRACDA